MTHTNAHAQCAHVFFWVILLSRIHLAARCMRSLLTTGKRKDFALREMRESNVSHTQRQTQKQRRHYNKHGYTNIIIHDPGHVFADAYSSSFQCQRPRAARQQSNQLFHAKGPGASLMGWPLWLSETRLAALVLAVALRFESRVFFAALYAAEDCRPAAAVLALAIALYFSHKAWL